LLTPTFKDLHIENSKNYKRWYCLHHTDCVSVGSNRWPIPKNTHIDTKISQISRTQAEL